MVGAETAGGYCWSPKRPRPAAPARAPAPARCIKFRLEKPAMIASRSSNRSSLHFRTAQVLLPLGHRPILVKSARHRPCAAKRVLGQAGFAQLEPQARPVPQGKPAIHHAHGRETEPFLPNFILR